jgi:hypothetical protein
MVRIQGIGDFRRGRYPIIDLIDARQAGWKPAIGVGRMWMVEAPPIVVMVSRDGKPVSRASAREASQQRQCRVSGCLRGTVC